MTSRKKKKKKTANRAARARRRVTKKSGNTKPKKRTLRTKKKSAKKPAAKKPAAKKPTAKKPTAKKPTAKKPAAKKPAAKKPAPRKPGHARARIGEHTPGQWTLTLDAAHGIDVFEACGRIGNGYDWGSVVDYLVLKRAPELRKDLHFDPEADMFAVRSTNSSALDLVSALIAEALENRALLVEAIENSEQD